MVKIHHQLDRVQQILTSGFYGVLKCLLSLMLGFLVAKCEIFENFSPFSLILLSVSPNIGLTPTFCYLGSATGIILDVFSLAVFKYITALTMIYIVYMVFRKSLNILNDDTAILSASCCFISGFLFLLIDRLTLFSVLMLIAESVLVCCCIYFISYAVRGFRQSCRLTSRELIAAVITLVLILGALHRVYLFSMSVARTVALVILFLGLYCLKISHTAVLGSCLAIILSVVGNGGESIFSAVIVSTLVGCVFSSFSDRFAQTAFLLLYYTVLFFYGKFPWDYSFFAEPMAAYTLTFLIPKRKLKAFLSDYIVVKSSKNHKEESETEQQSEDFNEIVEQLDHITKKIEIKLETTSKNAIFLKDEEDAIKKNLEKRKLTVKEINFITDEYGCKICDIQFQANGDLLYEKILRETVGDYFDRFNLKIAKNETGYSAHFREAGNYAVQCAALCKTQKGEQISGDTALGFSAGKDRYYLVLADGMGSGREAGVQSALIINLLRKLISGGMPVIHALNVYRSVARFRQDLYFTTVDLCAINLDSGQVDLYKAGAYDSFLINNQGLTVLKGGGIPLGLCEKDQLLHRHFQAEDGNVLILASDGLSLLEDQIEASILQSQNEDPRIYAKKLLHTLCECCGNANSDDVTVMVCKFHKNE